MTKERHGRFIMYLSDILLLLACLLFMLSMAEPFLMQDWHINYWSFVASDSGLLRNFWFTRYWFMGFDPERIYSIEADPTLLVSLFMTQVLTVVSGMTSVVFCLRKGWVRLIPFVSSVYVIHLMVLFHNELDINMVYKSSFEYRIGYWDAYPAALLFLLAFTTCLIAPRRKRQKEKTNDSE